MEASLLRDLQMANYGHGKKNLYYNISIFSCLCGSSALLATHADRAKNLFRQNRRIK